MDRAAYDAVVVGGGPAGAAAATRLARAGCSVALVDKARFPRDKTCGDGLTVAALRLLDELGLDPHVLPSWRPVHDVWLWGPNARSRRFPLPDGPGVYAASAQRLHLDAAVLDLARRAGAEIHDGRACLDVRVADDRVVATVEGLEPLTARYLVAADGAWSPVRKYVGLAVPGYRGDCHAFRQYASGVGPRATAELHVWFEPDLLPGYAWSFPLADGRANVGFGIHRGSTVAVRQMGARWRELLRRPHIAEVLGPDATLEGRPAAWPIPTRFDRVPLSAGRVLFVGDAAAATDPMSGEGIGQALETGLLAADAVLAAGPRAAADAVARYERDVRHALAADHAMSRLVLRLLRSQPGASFALAAAGCSPWTRRNFARWLFEDYPRALVATPRRWHRGMFTGPGAYPHRPAALDPPVK